MGTPEKGKPAKAAAKAPASLLNRIDAKARELLNKVLPLSVNGVPSEYGGVIYLDERTGALGSTGPFSEPGNTVDVRQDEPNMGCPVGTKPVAWYHTHPLAFRAGFTFEAKKFIDHDRGISDDHSIPGYLGVYDGTFWRYDPPDGELTPLPGKLNNELRIAPPKR